MTYSFLSGYSIYKPSSPNFNALDNLLIFIVTFSVSMNYVLKCFLMLLGSPAFSSDLCLIELLNASLMFLISSVHTYYSYVTYVPMSWNVSMLQLWPLLVASVSSLLPVILSL